MLRLLSVKQDFFDPGSLCFHYVQRFSLSGIAYTEILRTKDLFHHLTEIFHDLILAAVKILLQFFDKLVISDSCHLILECRHRRCVGSATENCRGMACTCKAGLGSGSHSGNDLIETFGVIQLRSCKNLPDHGKHEIHLRI